MLLKMGHYQISAIQTGYEQQERPLELASSSPARLTLPLKINGNVESITVVAGAGYTATSAITATRVPMSLLNTPQSIYAVIFTGTAPSVTLCNPDTSLAPTLSTTPSTSSRGFFQTAAVYTQDLMQPALKWKLL